MTSSGRVLIIPRGEWNKNTTYHMLDMVNHEGYAYLAKTTVTGIKPSGDRDGTYWHNLLNIKQIVDDSIAKTIEDGIRDILEIKVKEGLSEAKYVTDLFDDFDFPTFVRWDKQTANTPYTAKLTTCDEGYALVHGNYATNHTITAWAKGGVHNYTFMHTVSDSKDYGWDDKIYAQGGTLTGALYLGGGLGAVSADDKKAFLEAISGEDYTRLAVSPSEGDVKLIRKNGSDIKEYTMIGEHNALEVLQNHGFATIVSGSYIGKGKSGQEYANVIDLTEMGLVPKVVFVSCAKESENAYGTSKRFRMNPLVSGANCAYVEGVTGSTEEHQVYPINVTWSRGAVAWYTNSASAIYQMNLEGVEYRYVAICGVLEKEAE